MLGRQRLAKPVLARARARPGPDAEQSQRHLGDGLLHGFGGASGLALVVGLDNRRGVREYHGMEITGLELRLERVAARVKLIDLSRRMGRSRATVARYEGLAVVDPDIAYLYREALATFRVVAA
jgi:hypothetical protein